MAPIKPESSPSLHMRNFAFSSEIESSYNEVVYLMSGYGVNAQTLSAISREETMATSSGDIFTTDTMSNDNQMQYLMQRVFSQPVRGKKHTDDSEYDVPNSANNQHRVAARRRGGVCSLATS